ncbi:MAG: redoxin domain-containing protein [Planctomycetaceae bacterium]|nr:redoxin domain-containing protein [Planctomycetaceae bacterium]
MSISSLRGGLLARVLGGLLLALLPGLTAPLAEGGEQQKGFELGSWRGLEGRNINLSPPKGGLSVLLFYSSECPISNAYSPTLATLIGAFPAQRVRWVGVCVDPDLSDADVKTHARDFRIGFDLVRDRTGALARKLGASVTPEAFVIDDQGRLRYHGRIDDQFARRGVRNANPSSNELRDAIAAVLEGGKVKIENAGAVGCPIPQVETTYNQPTYTRDVALILQRNCLQCHRRGQVGPFPLETFEQARKRADDIALVVENRAMPPWKAARDVGVKFKHDRSLSQDEIDTISAWASSGAAEGDPALMPPAPKFPEDWTMAGGPDLVLDIGTDFPVPASGEDIYRCFVVPTNLAKDMCVSGVEYKPGNRRVVHHVLSYVDTRGEARKKDAAEPGPGYSCFSGPGVEVHGDLGSWTPGNQPSQLEDGIGRSLPRNADVIIQVHYHPSGKPEVDRTRIGLRFARRPVRQILHRNAALNMEMKLPAGESNIEVQAAWPVPLDLVAHAVKPHMHLLGKDMLMTVIFPDGREQDLVRIDDWDFNWQYTYEFEKPMDLPKGSVLKVLAHFDNSATNPRNPNKPPHEVSWGQATVDEMCIGVIWVTKKGQDLTRSGERDDLRDLFNKQLADRWKKSEEIARKRGRATK